MQQAWAVADCTKPPQSRAYRELHAGTYLLQPVRYQMRNVDIFSQERKSEVGRRSDTVLVLGLGGSTLREKVQKLFLTFPVYGEN